MKKRIAKFIFWIIGWKCEVCDTSVIKHSVMVAAPHTSNWDTPIALLAFWIMGIDLKFFIKNDYTRGPLGWPFKALGAIGVDRSRKNNNLTAYAIELLKSNSDLVILIPAEGTRKPVKAWRTGFYRVAREAGVPISLGFLDYSKKIAGVADVFMPSGDFEEDMTHIQEIYRTIPGKNPENYNPQIF